MVILIEELDSTFMILSNYEFLYSIILNQRKKMIGQDEAAKRSRVR